MLCEVTSEVLDSLAVYEIDSLPYLTRLSLSSSVSQVMVTESFVGVVFAILVITGCVVSKSVMLKLKIPPSRISPIVIVWSVIFD